MRRRWLAHAFAVGVLFVLCRLGVWQLDRAAHKHQIESAIRASQTEAPATFPLAPKHLNPWARYQTNELFVDPTADVYLLENRVLEGINGYDTFAPVRRGSHTFLIGLGWLPAPATRDQLPTIEPLPAQRVTLIAVPAPEAGIALSRGEGTERLAPNRYRVQTLRDLPDQDWEPDRLVLLAETPLLAGARPHLPEIRFTEQKHRAYAVQWFVMAAVFSVLYVRLQRRPTQRTDARET